MNRSSKMSVTGVSKSGNPRSGKGRKVHMPNVIKTKTTQQIKKNISAQKIQRAWLSHMDKTIFQLLKHTICAAEHFVSYEILKKVSPLEAELVKDPSMKCKVRFRFSGETFPPFIVFKIFLQTEGHGYKYFSGKNLLKPSSEAVVDACKIMGKKKFYHQIMEDEHLFQKFKVTDEIDVVTLKDYMQELQMDTPGTKQQKTIIFSTPSFDIVKINEVISDDKLEKEEKELFAWCQDLCINNSLSY
uniref:Chromosome X CXorf58 homolog n=1 Tax=Equus caballus TaxID=9796 RepID=A0A9L0RUH7_HORSE